MKILYILLIAIGFIIAPIVCGTYLVSLNIDDVYATWIGYTLLAIGIMDLFITTIFIIEEENK